MKVFANFQQKNGGDPTEAWQTIRIGKPTASQFKKFVQLNGSLRKGDMPETYLNEKLFERWTGREVPKKKEFFDVAMNNGVIIEERAAAFAAMEYGLDIQHVGFVSDDKETFGASPDGLIGFLNLSKHAPTNFSDGEKLDASGIEIKCPLLNTHIGYLRSECVPEEYVCQVQGSMFVTGCQTWHFLSYPMACHIGGFPPFHIIIERDEKWQSNFAESIESFLEKYDAEFENLVKLNGGLPKQKHRGLESLGEETKTSGMDYKAYEQKSVNAVSSNDLLKTYERKTNTFQR